ncbi:MAG: D-alanine--D-alanine ligase [Prevotella sp.]|nr:D-alanine--D-alanine ligase [Prevotella sp.]
MKNLKRTIAIVCGGDSSEHDVSLRSAQGLYSFFDKERYDVYIVDVRRTDWRVNLGNGEVAKIDKNDFSFRKDGKLVLFDYAYITIHGTPGENGLMQGYFELIDLPYSTSGVLVEALTFDKYVLNNYLRGYGVNVAPSMLVRRGEEDRIDEQKLEREIGMPCFVKPAADGSSFGVSKVKNVDQLAPALRMAFMESDEVMIESYMEGTEISIGVYKTREKAVVLPATEVVTNNEFFDYDAKYNGQVQEITPARLSPETTKKVEEETSRIYDILHANGIIRIDYIITKDENGQDKVMMLEINTTPGMTPTSFIPQQVRAAGLDIKEVLTDIVENQF